MLPTINWTNYKSAGRAFLLLVLVSFYASGASAQIRGLITQPATTSGQAVLDPNKDGYVSSVKTGFSANDVAESEIPYKAIPQLISDPTADLGPGPDCGFTDFVDVTSGTTKQAISMYVDANNNMMFRFRLGSASPNSKGYSVLIDTDNKFGNTGPNADPNYTSTNPGFEIELVLRTNFGVDVNDVDGKSAPVTKTTLSYNGYSQKSVAYSMNCGDYDYFYDFYVPIATITTYFPSFNVNSSIRLVGTTVIAPKSALLGPISDLGGVNDVTYNNNSAAAWSALMNYSVPTALSGIQGGSSFSAGRSDIPTISTPIASNSPSISGTSTEAAGTTIDVYKNGVFLKTTTVVSGTGTNTWSISTTGLTLAAGDKITAFATNTAASESISLSSTEVIVGGTTCSAAPTLNCSSDKGIIVNGPTGSATGTIINIYRLSTSGPQLISSGATDATGTYSYKCNDKFQNCNSGQACVVDGTYYFTATEAGKCESVPSAYLVNGGCTNTTAPTISVLTTSALSGTTGTAGQTILVSVNNVYYGSTTASSTGAWSYSGFSATAGQTVSVRGISNVTTTVKGVTTVSSTCATNEATATITVAAAAPVITSSITTSTTSISGTSTEADGSIITVYNNGTAIGTATVFGGVWTLNAPVGGFSLASGNAITAKVTTATNKTISDASNSVTVTSATARIPVITSPVKESATTISGTSTSPVGTVIKLYLDGDLIGTATVAFGAGGNTWSVTTIDPAYKLYPGGSLTATATETGLAEGKESVAVIIQCELPVVSKTVTATNTCQTYTTDVTISNPESSVLYRLRTGAAGSFTYLSSYAVALSGATSMVITSDALPNVTTLTITVEAMKIAPSSCTSDLTMKPVINVNALPVDRIVSGTATICSGASTNITVAASENGISYQLRIGTTNIGSPVIGNNNSINLNTGALNANSTYNVLATNGSTGCTKLLTNTATVTVNAQQKTISAVNNTVCSGGSTTIQVLNSENGASYQLKNGATNIGTAVTSVSEGSTISLPTGSISASTIYTVVSTKSGCTTTMTSTATVNVGTPLALTVTPSATTICAGSSVNLTIANSELGVNYQLMNGAATVGSPVAGTGSATTPLTLATITPAATTTGTTYSVVATRTTGTCSSTSMSVPAITVNVQPIEKSLNLGSTFICSGTTTTIAVGSPQTGVTYQLRTGTTAVGTPQSGATISFTVSPTASTTYNVLAYSTTGSCSLTLATTPTIVVNGTRTVAAVSSTLCINQITDITVQNSIVGVNYSLYAGSSNTAIVTIPGDGGTIGLPTGSIGATTTYTVKGQIGTSGCTFTTGTATVTIASPSNSLTVTAVNSNLCSGSSTNISVASSESGVTYQLQTSGGTNVGTPINGSGSTILLPTGALTSTTIFKVIATRSLGGCVSTLTNQPTVTVTTPPVVKTVTGPSTAICYNSATSITVSNVDASATYRLMNGTTLVDSKTGTAGTAVSLVTPVLTTTTTYSVIATTATCTTSLGTVVVSVIARDKVLYAQSPAVCSGGSTFINVDLSGSSVNYQLRIGTTNVGTPVAGNGGTISLPTNAITSATTFNVLAYSTSPACTTQLSLTPTVIIATPPAANLNVTAPSSVCSGTSANIVVENTQSGVNYILRKGTTQIGAIQPGNGSTLTFATGNLTADGTFNVVATDATYGCISQLTATPFVEVDCEAVYSPTSQTYASGYRFVNNQTIAAVSDSDGFDTTKNTTALLTAGTLPAGISMNPFTGRLYVSNVNILGAGSYTFVILTTDKNGKTTPHIFNLNIVNPGVPLPVEFINFNGKLVNGKTELTWATATEINNDFFSVERSMDGIKFSSIGTQKGAGNSQRILNYSFTDVTPLNGISYYRVKQTDFNGDFAYTKTIVIRNNNATENTAAASAYPNPVTNGQVNVTIPNSKGETLTLYTVDALGRVVYEQKVAMENNSTQLQLMNKDGSELKAGVYTILTQVNNQRVTIKLVVN
ncbi:MAG: T9SS type A sorting domain-containing protein [Sphingobacteriales bacterium]|nr:MAG: T9SS type A sorting domain-containing protein [Sphingobacteriales bacterium]